MRSQAKHLILLWLLALPLCSLRGQTNDGVLSAISVLTIHVNSTNTHEAVFCLLKDVLRLPVDYGPELQGERRYAAVQAGNLFIEPCGPFPSNPYPRTNFQALFYGLNCVSEMAPATLAKHLDGAGVAYEKSGESLFLIRDAVIAEGKHLGIKSRSPDPSSRDKENARRSALAAAQRDSLGFEYVKEIRLGYAEPAQLRAWAKILGSSGKESDIMWRLDEKQSLRFVQSEVPGVQGIVCKVRSLEKAQRYLAQTECSGRLAGGQLELNPAATFGLVICLTEE